MRRELCLLLCAIQFLTRLPVPALPGFEPAWITRSAKYFPLVGQLVGLLSAVVLLAAAQVWAGWIPVLLAVAASVLITGAFHEDGLADAIDGLGGGRDVAQRLAIMKDSRIGTYGVLALMLTIALKVAALGSLQPGTAAIMLVVAHGGGRAVAVLAMHAFPYAGDPDLAKIKPVGVGRGACLFALLLGFWPLVFLPPQQAIVGLAAGCLLAGLMAFAAYRLIRGYTGDVLGAIEQMFEVGFLLAVVARI